MTTEQQVYSIVYAGKLAPGKTLEEVKQKLATLFKRDPAQLETLFSGRAFTIKKGLALSLALKYLTAMAQAGAVAEIMPPPAKPAPHATPGTQAARPKPLDAPTAQPTPAQAKTEPRTPDPTTILKAFSGKIESVKITLAYRFWLLMVALGMITLVLVYGGVTALSAYGIYYYATDPSQLDGIRSGFVALILFLAPPVIGGILVLVMLRPFLWLFGKGSENITLTRDKEPLLFGFVETICQRVGAPTPRRIELDSQVNAAAGLRRGLLSFVGNDLTLTIGMPLVAGLTTRQFAGVLAHEFGHFAQGAGMRLTYLIRWINQWFAAAVYGRGGLDYRIEDWSESNTDSVALNFIALIFLVARMFVGIVRGVLWLFMMLGHAISGTMLRHMEFDADRYEARMIGSQAFVGTTTTITKLNVAMSAMHQDLHSTWENHRYLVDNLAEAVVDKARSLPKEALEQIRDHLAGDETGIFDTHPCDRERIDSAERENSPGIFKVELPASMLFNSFASWAKQATLKYYKDELGLKLSMQQLLPLSKIKGNVASEQNAMEVLDGYFRGSFNPFVPFHLPDAQQLGFGDEQGLKQRWQQSADEQYRDNGPAKLAWSRWNKADEQYHMALSAQTSLNNGLDIDLRAFGLQAPDPGLAQMKMDDAGAALIESMEKLGAYYNMVAARLAAVLGFLFRDEITLEIKERAALKTEVETILPSLPVLQNAVAHVTVLKEQLVILPTLFQALEVLPREEQGGVAHGLNKSVEDGTKKLCAIYDLFGELPYPFEHAKGQITLRQHAFTKDPNTMSPPEVISEIEAVINKVVALYARVLGRLTTIGHSVEQAAGLRAL